MDAAARYSAARLRAGCLRLWTGRSDGRLDWRRSAAFLDHAHAMSPCWSARRSAFAGLGGAWPWRSRRSLVPSWWKAVAHSAWWVSVGTICLPE